jgi:hypothetical protein
LFLATIGTVCSDLALLMHRCNSSDTTLHLIVVTVKKVHFIPAIGYDQILDSLSVINVNLAAVNIAVLFTSFQNRSEIVEQVLTKLQKSLRGGLKKYLFSEPQNLNQVTERGIIKDAFPLLEIPFYI